MIKQEEVFMIGKLLKPHGIKGEVAFAFENNVFDRVDCPYVVCSVDGLLIPFFINGYRFKASDTALLKFDGIDTEEQARKMSGLSVYFPRKYYEESDDNTSDLEYSWNYFMNFQIVNNLNNEIIGKVIAIDDSTINSLFLIETEEGTQIPIPATEDFIAGIDDKNKKLILDLPEGLLNC